MSICSALILAVEKKEKILYTVILFSSSTGSSNLPNILKRK